MYTVHISTNKVSAGLQQLSVAGIYIAQGYHTLKRPVDLTK